MRLRVKDNKWIVRLFMAILLAAALNSCQHQQELCLDHDVHRQRPVEIVFDWSEHPDASPLTMSLYLFPLHGGKSRRYEFNGHHGGTIMLAPDQYTAIAINSDTERTTVRNTSSLETFEIWLRGDFAIGQQRADAPLCNQSDMIWIGQTDNIDCRCSDSIIVRMYEAVCHCTVDVLNVTNHSKVHSVTATLSGMNESISALSRQTLTANSALIGFSMERPMPNTLHSTMLTLGHCGRQRTRDATAACDLPHLLSLYFTLNDGSHCVQSIDVADQMHTQSIEDCHIVIDTVTVPTTGTPPGGGLTGTVTDWGDEINIVIRP